MIAVDTSVVVAALASWHELHESATAVWRREPRLPAHVALETYAVLTRLPPPHRFPVEVVAELLAAQFPEAPLTLPGRRQSSLIQLMAAKGLAGGAIYDALVGATAVHSGATLVSRDQRARPVYELVGADVEWLE